MPLNFRRRPFCVQLCIETLYKWATSVAHLTNFSFEFFLWNFHRRCLFTSSIPWCKKVKNDQKLKSRGGGPALTIWVPCDGYIRHQNDHLSGRMTDISVMGEWQVAGVGGTRPLRNVFGDALKGRFSFEARKYLFSFPSYVQFEDFVCFPRFCKIWRQPFELWGFWFRRRLEALFETPLGHRASFCELRLRPRVFFLLKITFLFFKAEPVFLAWQLWWFPGWAKQFGDGTSKVRMKTSLPGVGEIERRRTIDRRRDWYKSLAVINGPKEKKHKEVSTWLCEVSTLHHLQNQRLLKNLFPRPDVATVLHFAVFVYVDVQLQVGQAAARGQRRKAVIRDISGVGHRAVTNLSATIWFTGERHCTVFRHVMELGSYHRSITLLRTFVSYVGECTLTGLELQRAISKKRQKRSAQVDVLCLFFSLHCETVACKKWAFFHQ